MLQMKFEFSFNLLTPENFRLLSEGRIVRLKIIFFLSRTITSGTFAEGGID